jgi:hypothetical protein
VKQYLQDAVSGRAKDLADEGLIVSEMTLQVGQVLHELYFSLYMEIERGSQRERRRRRQW